MDDVDQFTIQMFLPLPFFVLYFALGSIEAVCPIKIGTGCPKLNPEWQKAMRERQERERREKEFFRSDPPVPTSSGPYEYQKPAIFTMLKQHNSFRSLITNGKLRNIRKGKNIYKMVWDQELQKSAQNWANKCTIRHSNTSGVGENIFEFTSGNVFLAKLLLMNELAVSGWYDELENHPVSADYTYRGKEDEPIEDFVQLAWGAATKVGCGSCIKYDGSEVTSIVICHYDVPIVPGELIYESGEGCRNDEDCTTYPGSKCEASSKLCLPPGYVEEKFF